MSIEMWIVISNLLLTVVTIMNRDNAVNSFVHHGMALVVATETTTRTDTDGGQEQDTTTVAAVSEDDSR